MIALFNCQPAIILASASARRKQLLAEAGYNFTVITSEIDESDFSTEGISSCVYAEQLALAKAKDVAVRFADKLVIGADTIADLNGRIIGKPADAEDARRITTSLFSATHKVITGLAIVRLSDGIELTDSDTTIVYPKKLSPEQIEEHIKTKSWRGKAGAYAIQETGEKFIEKIEGSFTNVMGLPTELLQKMLKKISYTDLN